MSMVKYDILHGSNCISNYSCKIRYVHDKEYELSLWLLKTKYIPIWKYTKKKSETLKIHIQK